MQILTDPKSPFLCGAGRVSTTTLLGFTRVSLPNGIPFRPTVLAGCAIATDGYADTHAQTQTDRPRYGNICAIGGLLPRDALCA